MPPDIDMFNFLKMLVDYTREPDSPKAISYSKMGETFGLDQDKCVRNFVFLRGPKDNPHPYVAMVPGPDHQFMVMVTPEGYQYVDTVSGKTSRSGSSFNGCTFINSPVAGDNNSGAQTVNVTTYTDLKKVLADIEKALPKAGLTKDNEDMVREEIASLNEDMELDKPNGGFIKRGTKRVLSILQTSANIATVAPLIASLGQYLNIH